jgi:CRISPR-associated protein Csb2
MPLLIEQFFTQGRFHASRWRENPFADRFGEWPPSPWRLLRTLASRWFQYSRETGDRDAAAIEQLLRRLASRRPEYHLPPSASKEQLVKQYQPISKHSWSDPNAGSGAVKQAKTTLFPDPCFLIDPKEPVIWQWPTLDLESPQKKLLAQLLSRITYFGRAESSSSLKIASQGEEPNCIASADGGNAPVLCFSEAADLSLDALLAFSDREPLANAPVPPGTEWVFYTRPEIPRLRSPISRQVCRPVPFVQFAVGGHVLPKVASWIKVAERFRGRILKSFERDHESLPLLSGKTPDGQPLRGQHHHSYFLLWPDEESGENPSRLIVWRKNSLFQSEELEAMMLATAKPIPWTLSKGGWTAQLVPLPNDMALPKRFSGKSKVWESVTPFVRPHNRHFRRPNGKLRLAEEPESVCASLIEKVWGVRPEKVERIADEALCVKLHETIAMRSQRRTGDQRTPHVGPGYFLRVTFADEFQGPLIVGDSAHFGLGVFGSAPLTAPLQRPEVPAQVERCQANE